jgi:hypothetical protein
MKEVDLRFIRRLIAENQKLMSRVTKMEAVVLETDNEQLAAIIEELEEFRTIKRIIKIMTTNEQSN